MPIHPQVQAAITAMEQAGPLPHLGTPEEARETFRRAKHKSSSPNVITDDRWIPSEDGMLPVRIYTPAGSGPFPVLVYFHGGGWVLGGLDTVDYSCSTLSEHTGSIVMSVDYRLSPEHK